jgi:hypothetical protein
VRLEACRKECAFYQEHGKLFRLHHLENRKRIVLEQEDEEAFSYYPEGTTVIFSAEAQLRDWKEKDLQRNINTGQGPGWDYHGAHNTRNSQTNNLLGDTQVDTRKDIRWQGKL